MRARVLLWPRRSWRRSLRYAVLRLERIKASPHAIGLGVAAGVFASFQPIPGAQMLLAACIAWVLGGSVISALLGTFAGSPLTWPIMWLASFHLGSLLTGATGSITVAELWTALSGVAAIAGSDLAGAAAERLIREIIYPVAVGATPLGVLAGATIYVMVQRALALARH